MDDHVDDQLDDLPAEVDASLDLARWPAAVAALAAPGSPPIDAVFDMDGTLLGADLGDELVGWLLARGHLPPAFRARAPDLAAYQAATHGWDTVEQFILCSLVIEGLTEGELALQVRACLADRVPLRRPVVALARALARVGHRVWILTGSAEPIARVVAAVLGLDPARTVGLRLDRDPDTGRFRDRVLPPVTFGRGKVDAALARIGPDIGFSIGDSYTDLPLLERAHVAVAVPSLDGRLGPLAAASGIAVRLPEHLAG